MYTNLTTAPLYIDPEHHTHYENNLLSTVNLYIYDEHMTTHLHLNCKFNFVMLYLLTKVELCYSHASFTFTLQRVVYN